VVDRRVLDLARRQHGVVSTLQLLGLGLDRRAIHQRVAAGWLQAVHRGVYAVGAVPRTAEMQDMAAVLACGPAALLSHRSAAVRWDILRYAPKIEVTAPRSRAPRAGIVVHRSRLIHDEDRGLVDGIPVTSVARTIVDLAEGPERYLTAAVREAELRRLFDLQAIERTLARLPGRRGRYRLRGMLAAYRHEPRFTRSGAERRFLEICRTHGLPVPLANCWIGEFEVDFYWPDARLAVELDSPTFHMTTHAFHADRGGTGCWPPRASKWCACRSRTSRGPRSSPASCTGSAPVGWRPDRARRPALGRRRPVRIAALS
jgi:Transcriptional regulator, AbiEi antitoxin